MSSTYEYIKTCFSLNIFIDLFIWKKKMIKNVNINAQEIHVLWHLFTVYFTLNDNDTNDITNPVSTMPESSKFEWCVYLYRIILFVLSSNDETFGSAGVLYI